MYECYSGTLLETAVTADLDDFEDMPPTYGAVLAGELEFVSPCLVDTCRIVDRITLSCCSYFLDLFYNHLGLVDSLQIVSLKKMKSSVFNVWLLLQQLKNTSFTTF